MNTIQKHFLNRGGALLIYADSKTSYISKTKQLKNIFHFTNATINRQLHLFVVWIIKRNFGQLIFKICLHSNISDCTVLQILIY